MAQDVKTQWNSTYLILLRAMHLKDAIKNHYKQHQADDRALQILTLIDEEWLHVIYLI